MRRLLLLLFLLCPLALDARAQVVIHTGFTPPDTTAPTPAPDLGASSITDVSALISWTTGGDDGGSGTPASYEFKCVAAAACTSLDSAAEFNAASWTATEPAVASAGTVVSFTQGSLTPSTAYVCRVVTRDEVPNPPATLLDATTLSNCLQFTTAASGAYAQDNRSFDGSGDYVAMTNGLGESADRTYTHCAWAKLATAGVIRTVYSEADNSGTQILSSVQTNASGQLYCTYRNGGGSCPGTNCNQATSSASITDGQWHYVCCRSDGTEITAWIDGSQASAGELVTAPAAASLEYSTIGALRRGSTPTLGDYWDGDIAHVQVWSTAITTGVGSQMATSMTTPGCSTTNLVHYWPIKFTSPEVDAAPGGTQDSSSIVNTIQNTDQPASITSDCEN
jgi:hypothetical protein